VIEQDYFSLFGLPRALTLSAAELEAAWKRVATAVHPDRFATACAAEKRVAMQWSAHANEAYRVLKEPLTRARYLCELAGVDLQTETNTAMSPAFLMQQMEWHEQLDELQSHPDPSAQRLFAAQLQDALAKLVTQVGQFIDAERYTEAAVRIREWMFLDKLIAQLRAIES
jgi:molecular chaperone HscB